MPKVRESGRAIVIDDLGRVLLLHGRIRESPTRFAWYTPGGRLETGESFEAATARELAEELGLADVEVGPWVWTRHARRPVNDEWVPTTARFFVVRTTSFTPDTTGIGPSEEGVDWRWWTPDELDREPPANLIPPSLSHLVRSLVAGEIPETPIDVSDPLPAHETPAAR